MLMLRAAASHARASCAEGKGLMPAALSSIGSISSLRPSAPLAAAHAVWQRRGYATTEQDEITIPPLFTREEFREQKHAMAEAEAPTMFQYLKERFKRKLFPTRGDIQRYVKACQTPEDLDRTFYLYGLLREKYSDLHLSSGGLFMESCLNLGSLDSALRLLYSHRIYRLGLSKSPCTRLIAELGKAGRYEDMVAAAMFCYHVNMKMADKKTFNAVIYFLCSGEKLEEAVTVMETMKDMNDVFDRFQFRILLTECNRQMSAGDEKSSAASELRQRVAAILKAAQVEDPTCESLLAEGIQMNASNAGVSDQEQAASDKK
eukprot:765326-Hanusia_phi.AAC.2